MCQISLFSHYKTYAIPLNSDELDKVSHWWKLKYLLTLILDISKVIFCSRKILVLLLFTLEQNQFWYWDSSHRKEALFFATSENYVCENSYFCGCLSTSFTGRNFLQSTDTLCDMPLCIIKWLQYRHVAGFLLSAVEASLPGIESASP